MRRRGPRGGGPAEFLTLSDGAAERDRGQARDADHPGDHATAQLDRQRVAAGEPVGGEGGDHRRRGEHADRIDAAARDPHLSNQADGTASVMASAPTVDPVTARMVT